MPAAAGTEIERAALAEIASGSTGPWIVAFSGGPDSTALALRLVAIGTGLPVALHLVHVDHGMDGLSTLRAEAARALALALGLTFHLERRDVPAERLRGESPEAAARRVRYAALELHRRRLGADRILTAHHADDQIETVLLRLRSGSGIFGLAGIQARRGAIWRPALALRGCELRDALPGSGLTPVMDSSNADLRFGRNRLRRVSLPHLRARHSDLEEELLALCRRAAGVRERLTQRLIRDYRLQREPSGASLELSAVLPHRRASNLAALQVLEQLAECDAPSSSAARVEILRQLTLQAARPSPRMQANGWHVAGGRLHRSARTPAESLGTFSYNLSAPGEAEIHELGGVFRMRCGPVEDWMRRGETMRAGLRMLEPPGSVCEVRNRRPGDRLRPLGAPGMRGLKELLIDRKVPRAERDRIPLLLLGGRIAWVPGITIDDSRRLGESGEESQCWIAEWLPDRFRPALRSTLQADPIVRPEEPES